MNSQYTSVCLFHPSLDVALASTVYVVIVAEEEHPDHSRHYQQSYHAFLHLLESLQSQLTVPVDQHKTFVSPVTVEDLLYCWSWLNFYILCLLFTDLQTKEVEALCVDLLVEAVHRLLDLQLLLEEHTESQQNYKLISGSFNDLGASLCLEK